ncbi:MAG: DUF3467 domain-containing protein [Prevotellaceae bacterium]|jgi:hypothetical protein|nr:DUF3467 domain-containing protein [Prevotellaceae bacterium]
MENKEKKPDNQLNIELSADVADGIYSNLAVISHSSSEFVLDFIRMLPGTPKANVKARIILTPEHAKRLMLALSDNISKYEKQYGNINLSQRGAVPQAPLMGFGGGLA